MRTNSLLTPTPITLNLSSEYYSKLVHLSVREGLTIEQAAHAFLGRILDANLQTLPQIPPSSLISPFTQAPPSPSSSSQIPPNKPTSIEDDMPPPWLRASRILPPPQAPPWPLSYQVH